MGLKPNHKPNEVIYYANLETGQIDRHVVKQIDDKWHLENKRICTWEGGKIDYNAYFTPPDWFNSYEAARDWLIAQLATNLQAVNLKVNSIAKALIIANQLPLSD